MNETTPPPSSSQPRRRRTRSPVRGIGWGRRLARLWGFLGFAILVAILTRHVLLPFVFAVLIAYILAPVVDWMSARKDGTRIMPRAAAILICYFVLLAFLASFVVLLMPRLSKDAARIGAEAPELYAKINEQWVPAVGKWVAARFPQVAAEPDVQMSPPPFDVTVPEHTAFVVTPLPDGRLAVQLQPGGIVVAPSGDGGFYVTPSQEMAERRPGLEDRLRAWVTTALTGLQSQIGNLVVMGQALVSGLIRSVFRFFLVLMVAAFILMDLDKMHGFMRGLIPAAYRDDYDVIAAGINRGLAGVIRGQLLICLVNGVLTYIGLVIFSVKYSLILAVVAAVMSLIPIFGSILSTLPIVLAALVSGEDGIDIMRGIFMVAWIVGIHFLEANFLNPKIIGTAAKIHPVLVIFALIVGEHSYGLVGALLAVPVTSMVQVLFIYFRKKAWRTDTLPTTPRPYDDPDVPPHFEPGAATPDSGPGDPRDHLVKRDGGPASPDNDRDDDDDDHADHEDAPKRRGKAPEGA